MHQGKNERKDRKKGMDVSRKGRKIGRIKERKKDRTNQGKEER